MAKKSKENHKPAPDEGVLAAAQGHPAAMLTTNQKKTPQNEATQGDTKKPPDEGVLAAANGHPAATLDKKNGKEGPSASPTLSWELHARAGPPSHSPGNTFFADDSWNPGCIA